MDDDQRRVMYSIDEAFTHVGFGKYQGLVLVYAGLGLFAEATEMMILSFIGQAVKSEWKLSSTQQTLLTSVVFAGLLLGSFFWGFVSDHYGRRHGFLGIALVASVTGLLSAFSPNYLSLVILRGLVGFGLGSGPVFLSWFLEFVPASSRGLWMVVISIFWTLGTISEAALAWIVMPRLNWRWLLALSSVPSFAVLLFHGLSPESPRYLYMKGRSADAQHVLEKLADASLYINVFVTSLAELPGLLFSAVIVDRVGRKVSMTIMSILTFIFLLPLVIIEPVTLTTGLLFAARMFANGTYTVASIYAPEVYPTSIRATGSGIASAVGRIGGMVCPLVAVGLVSDCHQGAAIILLDAVIILSVVCILLFPFETKGQELTDTLVSDSK
ncbi:hypothetical protein LWI29_036677 [Acer saccharum]|uniref:Major facilitator superfamily (MFS) profile domain-containing protein n=1 Tax=Acer saccharum TaxID=4024 RepID=A0AA39RFW1_ACESA|nr:hypothetical protein LWI29_036677 [Acer saccharum]